MKEEKRWKKTEVSLGSFKQGINHCDSLSLSIPLPGTHTNTHLNIHQYKESRQKISDSL